MNSSTLELGMPKPKFWDFVAAAVALAAVVLMGVNFVLAGTGISTLFVFLQVAISLGALLVLGKTAKEGTIWGNLAATAAMLAGIGGVMLAAAMWAIA